MKSTTRPAPERTPLRLDAAGACDAYRSFPGPISLLLEASRLPGGPYTLLAIDTPSEVDRHPAAAYARRARLPYSVLLPGRVNAHTHLDLTHIGPRAFDPDGGFTPWLGMVTRERLSDPAEIARSVRRGVELSMAGGTVCIGDIAGATRSGFQTTPAEELAKSPLFGVTFLEFFGLGTREALWRERLDLVATSLRCDGLRRVSLSPHSPLSVSRALYGRASELVRRVGSGNRPIPHGPEGRSAHLPIATHLAESPAEREFLRTGGGPHRDFLEQLGLWAESCAADLGTTPGDYIRTALETVPHLCAHVNDCSDELIGLLRATGASVAYCPRASAYFGFDRAFGPHRYRDLLAAGVNVCLGTDSIINLPDGPDRALSTLDEARFLHARDGTDPRLLLEMATTAGARSLGFDPAWWRFQSGLPVAGIAGVAVDRPFADPLESLFSGGGSAGLLLSVHGPTRTLLNTIAMDRDRPE